MVTCSPHYFIKKNRDSSFVNRKYGNSSNSEQKPLGIVGFSVAIWKNAIQNSAYAIHETRFQVTFTAGGRFANLRGYWSVTLLEASGSKLPRTSRPARSILETRPTSCRSTTGHHAIRTVRKPVDPRHLRNVFEETKTSISEPKKRLLDLGQSNSKLGLVKHDATAADDTVSKVESMISIFESIFNPEESRFSIPESRKGKLSRFAAELSGIADDA